MPTLPVPTQTDAVAQNTSTGAIDYLKYSGSALVSSLMIDYGMGPSWKLVASGNIIAGAPDDLVFQNNATGQLDFLGISATGALVNSFETSFGLPAVHGEGFFNFTPGGTGPQLLSQLPDGEIDVLGFNTTGGFAASDLIPGTAGFPTLVGAGLEQNGNPAFANIAPASIDSAIITQLPNGELDAIGITGSIATGSLAVANTMLMPQTIGAFPVSVVDPDFSSIGLQAPEDVLGAAGTFGVQMLTQSAAGNPDTLYVDSGYATSSATEGSLYGSLFLQSLGANWRFADGSAVVHNIFPVS
jgi:hypothetical protein